MLFLVLERKFLINPAAYPAQVNAVMLPCGHWTMVMSWARQMYEVGLPIQKLRLLALMDSK